MIKQYKSSITKNHKIKMKECFEWCSLKRLRSLLSYFYFLGKKKKKMWENQVTNDA